MILEKQEWLKKWHPCEEAVDFIGDELDTDKILQKLLDNNKLSWANWFIVRIMTYDQYTKYAAFASAEAAAWALKASRSEAAEWAATAAAWAVPWAAAMAATAAEAAEAANRVEKCIMKKILNYGINLLKESADNQVF